MLANTLTVTINSVAKVLVRVNQSEPFSSQYQLKTATESLILKIRNTTERANGAGYDRHNVELSHLIYATSTDPEKHYVTSQTFKNRTIGSDPAVLVQEVAALATLINAQATAIAGGES